MLNDDLNENNNQDEEFTHDVTREIADKLASTGNEMLIIPDHFDGTIDKSAFYYKSNIKSIKANNITQIKCNAFYCCRSLVEADFPNVDIIDDNVFDNTSIEMLNLPKLETISSRTFMDMEALKTIYMNNLKNITDKLIMFEKCPNLEEIRVGNEEIGLEILIRLDSCCKKAKVYIGDSNEPISANENFSNITDIYQETAKQILNSEYYVDGNLTIPENFNGIIGNKAFISNKSIKSINFNNIKTIGDNSFNSCNNLVEVYGDNVTKIDSGAFFLCNQLSTVNFPNVNEVCDGAFDSCKHLTQISFPNIQSVDWDTFNRCWELQEVNLPSVTEVKDSAFCGCMRLETIDLPNAKTIGNDAFHDCIQLSEIIIPKVSAIGSGCFVGCESLTEINLPSVTEIEKVYLSGCKNLNQISLPSVTKFEKSLFEYVSRLKKIYIPSIESLNKSAFKCCLYLEEIITGTPEQCELIFKNIDESNRKKIIDGRCKLFYEGEVWDHKPYLEQMEAQERQEREEREAQARQERERLKQEKQQIIDNFFETVKTPETDIRTEEVCPVCYSEFKNLENDNFVCTMHEDSESKIQHQICKDCFFGLIQFKNCHCPICRRYLGVPGEVIQAIETIVELEQQDNN